MAVTVLASQSLTIDFMKLPAIPGLATASSGVSDTPVEYTVDGTTFSIVQSYKANNSFLMLYKSKGVISFTATKKVEQISITTPASGTLSKSATLELYVNNVATGQTINASENGKEYIFTPDETAAGTVYALKNVKSYNVQVAVLTVKYEGEETETPVDPVAVEVASIKELLEANKDIATNATSEDKYRFTCPLTAIYQAGQNLYVTDTKGGFLLVYGAGGTYVNGDVIPAGMEGYYKDYNALPEFAPDKATIKPSEVGTKVEPIPTTVEDASAEGVSAYVKISNVSISNVNGKNFTITDAAGNTIAGYNSLSANVEEGVNLVIEGFVNIYNTTYQISPCKITNAAGQETVKTPYFNPAAGEVAKGTKVQITCSTAGSTIYYTLDGTTPSDKSTKYDGQAITINEAMTIKAIAYAEGMAASHVAVAQYTIKEVSANVAMFNFADPSTLTPTFTYNEAEKIWMHADTTAVADGTTGNMQILVTGVEFTNGNVTVSSTKGSNDAKIYIQSSGKIQLRVYNGGSTTIASTDANNPITKITFTYNNGTTSSNKVTAPTVGTWAAPVWTGSENSVVFKYTGTQQINAIEVECKNDLSGIENILDDVNAPVEYYNLQGMKVENPANGLYIRRQGNKATKIIL